MTKRLFIAIPLPEEIRRGLQNLQDKIKESYSDVFRILKPENLHLTLHFLGNIDVIKIPALQDNIGSVISGHRRFKLGIKGIGAFPSFRKPKILWAGAASPGTELVSLHRNLMPALTPLGIEIDERPFRGHITLAYGRKNIPFSRLREGGKALRNSGWTVDLNFPAETVILYQSELSSNGARHLPVQVFELPD
jgi:2'-5' RNA ligase